MFVVYWLLVFGLLVGSHVYLLLEIAGWCLMLVVIIVVFGCLWLILIINHFGRFFFNSGSSVFKLKCLLKSKDQRLRTSLFCNQLS